MFDGQKKGSTMLRLTMCSPALRSAVLLLAVGWIAAAVPARLAAQTVPPATPEEEQKLLGVLQSSDATLKDKMAACRGLAVIGTKKAVPVLAGLLADEQLSHMARYALEPIDDPSVDQALRDAVGKVKGKPLAGVAASLGVRRDAQAVGTLSALLDHEDADVAAAAARSLGKIGSPEAAKALTAKLAAPRKAVRAAVAEGCLGIADAMLARGQRADAAALFEAVAKADLPKHFKLAAMQGAIQAR